MTDRAWSRLYGMRRKDDQVEGRKESDGVNTSTGSAMTSNVR